MALVSGKWKMQILCSLYNNDPIRYGQLRKTLNGMPSTVLVNTLRELEEGRLVHRQEHLEVPIRVEHVIIEPCHQLILISDAPGDWNMTL